MNKKHNLLQTPKERLKDENITNKIEITRSDLFNGRDNNGYIDLAPIFANIGEIKYLPDSLGSHSKFFIEGNDLKLWLRK